MNSLRQLKAPDKAVILSEALRRSTANRELYGAESKDPGDACWQMLLGTFRPQATTEDKKVTNFDHSEAEVEGPAVFFPYSDSFFSNAFSEPTVAGVIARPRPRQTMTHREIPPMNPLR
jgi:hypothetical protein